MLEYLWQVRRSVAEISHFFLHQYPESSLEYVLNVSIYAGVPPAGAAALGWPFRTGKRDQHCTLCLALQ